MNRAKNQRWRRRVASVARLIMVGVVVPDQDYGRSPRVEDAELMRRKKTPRVVKCAGVVKCKLDGQMIVVRTFDRAYAFKRQVVLSPGPVSIANPVATLP